MSSHSELANAIRALSFDAVEKANSGHPGMPMGMADIATVLWRDFLQHNPKNPKWTNRDRFVLSNGHGSMLLYSLLHLTGYDLPLSELQAFRQIHSKTPGHPEVHITPGVETTTGPLGQGIANAVGMALAEKLQAAHFNRDGFPIVDHFTYVFTGDGCLMEGISHEVCSLAGTWNLNKLIVIYDDNGISIDGEVAAWFSDNTVARFQAYGWHVVPDVDGHDPIAIAKALAAAKANTRGPTLICAKTTIGYGAPNLAGSEKSHGSPLGAAEIAATREALNWNHPPFEIPEHIYKEWDATTRGADNQRNWDDRFNRYCEQYPALGEEFKRRNQGKKPTNWQQSASEIITRLSQANQATAVATRKSSLTCIEAFSEVLPELIGGSADLSGSNCTLRKAATPFSPEHLDADYIFYGVREFGMSAIMNGLALYGGFIPFGGTFLTFSDYARNAVRMAALMQQQCIFIYTHDSIGLGEDGPTHQAIEHAASLRLIPGLSVWRPCDTAETAIAWRSALTHQGPTCLLLSRQNLEQFSRNETTLQVAQRGGYILQDCVEEPEAILIATGSEVSLAMAAAAQLTAAGHQVRVVSMPSVNVFEQQDPAYREAVLPQEVTAKVAIEAGSPETWYRYVGQEGRVIGIERFGESAPAADVYCYLGITTDNIIKTVLDII